MVEEQDITRYVDKMLDRKVTLILHPVKHYSSSEDGLSQVFISV